jgi:hypothetical protein
MFLEILFDNVDGLIVVLVWLLHLWVNRVIRVVTYQFVYLNGVFWVGDQHILETAFLDFKSSVNNLILIVFYTERKSK